MARSPTEIPAKGWWDVLKRVWVESGTDNIGLIAAGVAFYGFLALVPLLAAFVLTYGLIADPATVMDHIGDVFALLPEDAAKLISEQMVSVTQQATAKTGLGLILAMGLALYGAMNGASAVITALNVAYDEEESRSLFKTYGLALVITLGMVLVGVLGVLAITALAFMEGLFPHMPGWMLFLVRSGFWITAAAAASGVIAIIYRYGPDRRRARWRWLTPGSVFATVGWLLTSLGFALYARSFGNYNATYGALGAVVVLLMWLYLSAYVLLLGAELNSEIEHQTAVDSTVGPEKPMGERGAFVADTVGRAA